MRKLTLIAAIFMLTLTCCAASANGEAAAARLPARLPKEAFAPIFISPDEWLEKIENAGTAKARYSMYERYGIFFPHISDYDPINARIEIFESRKSAASVEDCVVVCDDGLFIFMKKHGAWRMNDYLTYENTHSYFYDSHYELITLKNGDGEATLLRFDYTVSHGTGAYEQAECWYNLDTNEILLLVTDVFFEGWGPMSLKKHFPELYQEFGEVYLDIREEVRMRYKVNRSRTRLTLTFEYTLWDYDEDVTLISAVRDVTFKMQGDRLILTGGASIPSLWKYGYGLNDLNGYNENFSFRNDVYPYFRDEIVKASKSKHKLTAAAAKKLLDS